MNLECREIEELTTAYLADQLSVHEGYRVEMHLDSCPACASELEEMRSIANLLGSEFQSENQAPVLDTHRRKSLQDAWNLTARPTRYSTHSKWRTARRITITFATAASVMVGSYLGFVSGHQRIQSEDAVSQTEIANLPLTVAITTETKTESSRGYTAPFAGTAYAEIARIINSGLPEYGMGSAVFASRPRVSRTRAPYIGLPVPRSNYDFEDTSFGNE